MEPAEALWFHHRHAWWSEPCRAATVSEATGFASRSACGWPRDQLLAACRLSLPESLLGRLQPVWQVASVKRVCGKATLIHLHDLPNLAEP